MMQKRIVIADDDPTMRSALGEALRSAGYDAISFPNSEEAERYVPAANGSKGSRPRLLRGDLDGRCFRLSHQRGGQWTRPDTSASPE